MLQDHRLPLVGILFSSALEMQQAFSPEKRGGDKNSDNKNLGY